MVQGEVLLQLYSNERRDKKYIELVLSDRNILAKIQKIK